ncbi:MAG: hypothetical protein KAR42_02435 [candidate division Zixibacteria bacterium]|nr:hypothetical protein [candidate division Zixibacteria bacterium]
MIKRLSVFPLYAVLLLLFIFPTISLAQDETTETGDSLAVVPALDSVFIEERTPLPAGNVVVKDHDNDAGEAIDIKWDKSPDDFRDGKVKEYLIMRSDSADGPFELLGSAMQGESAFTDYRTAGGQEFYYKIVTINYEKLNGTEFWRASSESSVMGPVKATAQWFNTSRLNIFIGIFILAGAIIYFIFAAKGGKKFYIRKIAGIEEVENAVGRATEMGRSIYYVPGIHDMDDVQTIASMTILGRVSEIAAENDTRIDVPVCRSMVMVTAKEVVKEAFSKAGRPDSFMDDQVRYLTDDQFGYAAAIDGLFVREKPATIFMIGTFFAESLIIAETGNSIGAIQIAGTAMPAQLPFFVAACDYTLIGEELFAASAYLSGEPKLLGSLKGQDVGKAIFIAAIIIGCLLETFTSLNVSALFSSH